MLHKNETPLLRGFAEVCFETLLNIDQEIHRGFGFVIDLVADNK